MTYFESLSLCIFALVSDVAIYSVQQSGQKKSFNQVATHQIDPQNEYIPTCIDAALHKVSGKLLICLAL
jgi:hypothetical protein